MFIKPYARHSTMAIYPVLLKQRSSFLVIRYVGGKPKLTGNHSAECYPFCIQEYPFIVIAFYRLLLINYRVNSKKKVFIVYFDEICFCFIESIPNRMLAGKIAMITRYPFRII